MSVNSRVVLHRVLQGSAAIGLLGGFLILWTMGIDGFGGTGGEDALAYWASVHRPLDGAALYGASPGSNGAYLYSPLFAQVLVPVGALPAPVFVWLWRLLELVCLRVAVGSWTRAGIAILVFPPVIIELAYANVNLVIAAICAMVMRGRAEAWSVPVVVKLAGWPLIPLALVRSRRGFVVGAVVAALAVGVSVLVAPDRWSEFLAFLPNAPEPTWWTNLSQGVPLVLRLALAGALAIASLRWPRLLPFAVVIGQPIVWLTSLSILVAVVAPIAARRSASDRLEVPPWMQAA